MYVEIDFTGLYNFPQQALHLQNPIDVFKKKEIHCVLEAKKTTHSI